MAPAPQSFENRDGAIGIQTVGGEMQPEAPHGGGFGGTWPGEGGRGGPSFQLQRQTGATRRSDGLAACRPGGRFQRFTPRGLLRWRGTRGALRVLFFLGVSPPAKKSTRKRSQALLFFRGGAASNWTKAAVRRPGPRLFFPHLKRRRERKAAQKKGLGSRRSGGNVVLVHPAFGERRAAPRAPQSGAQGAAGSEASEA